MILLRQNVVERVFLCVVSDFVVKVDKLFYCHLRLHFGVLASEPCASELYRALDLIEQKVKARAT